VTKVTVSGKRLPLPLSHEELAKADADLFDLSESRQRSCSLNSNFKQLKKTT
jgi:hypothetical protein